MDYYNNDIEEEIRKRKRAAKAEAIRKKKKQQRYLRICSLFLIPLIIIITVIIVLISKLSDKPVEDNTESIATIEKGTTPPPEIGEVIVEETVPESRLYSAHEDADTASLPSDVVSTYGILVDTDNDRIIAQQNARTRINPASMTKIMTVLVAAEHVKDLDDTMQITLEFTDYSYANDLSAVGFAENEVVSIRDLFYGTILPSGGDAGIALATYVAGSEESFVEMMNDKLEELQLSDSTHFTNCVGLYDENHYSTVYDMAMILRAAIDNDLCKEVLSAHTYTTSSTPEHPEGITISNWFLRRIEDKDCGMTVTCAKTGFVVQSGNCAASFAVDSNNKGYICCTANSSSSWRCIYDHVSIYGKYRDYNYTEPTSSPDYSKPSTVKTENTGTKKTETKINNMDEILLDEDSVNTTVPADSITNGNELITENKNEDSDLLDDTLMMD